jgi:hypothetical protein
MAASPVARNRRQSPRRATKSITKVVCLKGGYDMGRNLTVSPLDISESGLRLIVCDALDIGQEVTLKLEGLGHSRPLKMHGNVMWCVATAEKQFCIGIRFQKFLPYAELTRLS